MLTEGVVLPVSAGSGLALGLAGVRALIALSARHFRCRRCVAASGGAGVHDRLAVVRGSSLASCRRSPSSGHTSALLKEDATRGSASRTTGLTRATLVIAEVALALVLLGGRAC